MSIFTKALSLLLVFSIFSTGCTLGPVFGGDIPIGPKGIIYKKDDRKDYYEIYEIEIQEQAKACPVLLHSSRLKQKEDGNFEIKPHKNKDGSFFTYGERYNFEEVTKTFANQPMAGSCSAFLVAPNIVITAGHCFHEKTETQIKGMRFVFGFWMNSKNEPNLNVPSENVYSVKRVIHYEYSPISSIDYAVIELDRECTVAKPLEIASDEVNIGDYVYSIGYPNGLPLKYSPNAEVFRVNDNSFVASLDLFKGNSGSPVFNANGEVVGVYISTYLIIIGTNYYGRLKPWGHTPTDLSGNRSTHAKYWKDYISD